MQSPRSDSASSLRELALKSIKSRRKPLSAESLLPLRPPPAEASLQLDYGQEERSPSSDAPPPADPAPPAAVPPPQTPKPPSLSISMPPVPDTQAREEGEISDEEEAQAAPQHPKPPSPPAGSRHSTPSAAALVPFGRLSDLASGSQPRPSSVQTDSVPVLSVSSYSLDTDHIRPGVALNQDQYDKAKDIVLDLLGWGVDPEYLVDCGVTREVVYYVFTELNLRLPQNLDTIGLVPFTPEDALELKKSVMMPPPPLPVLEPPSVPTTVIVHTPSPPPPAARAIESPRPVSSSDLHDMEQQRRQELMARKAAIASKKSKNVPPSTTPSADMNIDSVEDFLKTIESSHNTATDDMDIDEIPGLSGASSYKASSHISTLVSPTGSTCAPLSPNEAPPSSAESGSSLTETEGPTVPRRVFKRPVASDFVDFDESRPPSNNSRNGHRHANGGQRRKATGFASVISQPRCIIDVSDSEGEGDGDVAMRDMETAWGGGFASPVPTKAFTHVDTNGWATPPVSTPTPTGSMTPAVLLEKENEIQRMREIIAQKERRLKEAKALDMLVKREETPVVLAAESSKMAISSEGESPVTAGSSHSTPVASTDSIGCLFRLPPLPTSD
ncbi:hypothetical protein C0993_006490 [Termitomyces sp. T159_Od127]|nr:hypothetical protein C0993_006490 [Termitomyces sp. T159_Od127]